MGTDMTASWLHIVCDYGTSSIHLSLICDAQCAVPTTTKASTPLDDDDDDDDDDDGDILYASESPFPKKRLLI
jgi:hypothetical protein